MMRIFLIPLLGFLSMQQISCTSDAEISYEYSKSEFSSYWYRGEAEISSYNLQQARYGELREGQAVLIFVTEDFSKTKHVKLDNPRQADDDAEKILKLNLTKKFITGIYPYSMMLSVFTPVEQKQYNPTMKITATSQEWCGHTFTQINRIEDGYKGHLYSYFEKEGDQKFVLKNAIAEDEIWTMIRLAPEKLPRGEFNLIPGTLFQRISHCEYSVHEATGELKVSKEDKTVSIYTVTCDTLDRTLSIRFKNTFPFHILSWEEKHDGMTTKVTLKKAMMIDYWNKNKKSDKKLRKNLGLKY